jgi:hypothetical protein
MNDQREGIPLDCRVLYFAFYIYQDILRQEEKTMSMTPEEINRIYIQEHGMTKGAFSVGLQGSLIHRNSVEEWAEGDPVKVWLEGKDVGEKSVICIAYESGRWWHYKKADNGFAWW